MKTAIARPEATTEKTARIRSASRRMSGPLVEVVRNDQRVARAEGLGSWPMVRPHWTPALLDPLPPSAGEERRVKPTQRQVEKSANRRKSPRSHFLPASAGEREGSVEIQRTGQRRPASASDWSTGTSILQLLTRSTRPGSRSRARKRAQFAELSQCFGEVWCRPRARASVFGRFQRLIDRPASDRRSDRSRVAQAVVAATMSPFWSLRYAANLSSCPIRLFSSWPRPEKAVLTASVMS